jgi:hypothetical protein
MDSEREQYIAIHIESAPFIEKTKANSAHTSTNDDDTDSVLLVNFHPHCKYAVIGICILGVGGFILYIFIHFLQTT